MGKLVLMFLILLNVSTGCIMDNMNKDKSRPCYCEVNCTSDMEWDPTVGRIRSKNDSTIYCNPKSPCHSAKTCICSGHCFSTSLYGTKCLPCPCDQKRSDVICDAGVNGSGICRCTNNSMYGELCQLPCTCPPELCLYDGCISPDLNYILGEQYKIGKFTYHIHELIIMGSDICILLFGIFFSLSCCYQNQRFLLVSIFEIIAVLIIGIYEMVIISYNMDFIQNHHNELRLVQIVNTTGEFFITNPSGWSYCEVDHRNAYYRQGNVFITNPNNDGYTQYATKFDTIGLFFDQWWLLWFSLAIQFLFFFFSTVVEMSSYLTQKHGIVLLVALGKVIILTIGTVSLVPLTAVQWNSYCGSYNLSIPFKFLHFISFFHSLSLLAFIGSFLIGWIFVGLQIYCCEKLIYYSKCREICVLLLFSSCLILLILGIGLFVCYLIFFYIFGGLGFGICIMISGFWYLPTIHLEIIHFLVVISFSSIKFVLIYKESYNKIP